MVIDTSAIVAILQDEPERPAFSARIEKAPACRVSAATLVEASIVIEARFGAEGVQELDLLIDRAAFDVVPVDAAQAREARRAWRRYGKGRHAAGMNYGDIFSYALARVLGEPLLFKGDDFARTDLVSAMEST